MYERSELDEWNLMLSRVSDNLKTNAGCKSIGIFKSKGSSHYFPPNLSRKDQIEVAFTRWHGDQKLRVNNLTISALNITCNKF